MIQTSLGGPLEWGLNFDLGPWHSAVLPHAGGSFCPKSVGRPCGGDTKSNRGPPLWVIALLLRALEAFGYYVSLLSAKSEANESSKILGNRDGLRLGVVTR